LVAGIEVTFTHSLSSVSVDSFSFAGGRFDDDQITAGFSVSSDSSIVSAFALLGEELLPAGRGLLGNIYYSFAAGLAPQVMEIDTITWTLGMIDRLTAVQGQDVAGDPWIPQIVKGHLDIQDAPLSFDSVWVDSVGIEAGSPVAVNAFAFNERNLAQIDLALKFDSDRLTLDSVAFTGTRGEAATTKTVQPNNTTHTVLVRLVYGSAVPLAPGSGPLAILHFSTDGDSPDTLIAVDSTTLGVNTVTRYILTEADGSIVFPPMFSAGYIHIQTVTDVEDITPDGVLPETFNLAQNYPNPFNPVTHIDLSLPSASHVELEVFNVLGQKVEQLLDRDMPAGVHRVAFDGSHLASGVYFYRITAGDIVQSKKMIMIK
ncbi:MAG: T9SS type A sorting domain-containing protein, partial [candidate division Zixibacteria bacterium]|nr:T9SS type A sorting domain-containing protein [candidate division Zixibacteria bacterium]